MAKRIECSDTRCQDERIRGRDMEEGSPEDFSNHGAGCRKRAGTLLRTDSGMHADIPAGKDPTLHSLLAEPVPI